MKLYCREIFSWQFHNIITSNEPSFWAHSSSYPAPVLQLCRKKRGLTDQKSLNLKAQSHYNIFKSRTFSIVNHWVLVDIVIDYGIFWHFFVIFFGTLRLRSHSDENLLETLAMTPFSAAWDSNQGRWGTFGG